jgi:hypothetical protein
MPQQAEVNAVQLIARRVAFDNWKLSPERLQWDMPSAKLKVAFSKVT